MDTLISRTTNAHGVCLEVFLGSVGVPQAAPEKELAAAVPVPQSKDPASYTNRMGAVYYLHAGTTKTGKTRYFVAKTPGPGSLPELPAGFEFTESINGVVSVSRVDAASSSIPAVDVERVRQEVARHGHLQRHRVELRKDEILIHEPEGCRVDLSALGFPAPRPAAYAAQHTKYAPVMKFVAARSEPGIYTLSRMSYRGAGGWRYLSAGPLRELLPNIRHVGTEQFFELY
jgi:hypothetical protein